MIKEMVRYQARRGVDLSWHGESLVEVEAQLYPIEARALGSMTQFQDYRSGTGPLLVVRGYSVDSGWMTPRGYMVRLPHAFIYLLDDDEIVYTDLEVE